MKSETIITKEKIGKSFIYTARETEHNIASQGNSKIEALINLKKAKDLFLNEEIWKCKTCGSEDFILMDTTLMCNNGKVEEPYYYHYSGTYKKCRQRIDYKDIFRFAKVTSSHR